VTDREKKERTQYKVKEYLLGSVPNELRSHKGWKVQTENEEESDHNYLIVPVEGGEKRVVNENELES
jgi:hypothetical protein